MIVSSLASIKTQKISEYPTNLSHVRLRKMDWSLKKLLLVRVTHVLSQMKEPSIAGEVGSSAA